MQSHRTASNRGRSDSVGKKFMEADKNEKSLAVEKTENAAAATDELVTTDNHVSEPIAVENQKIQGENVEECATGEPYSPGPPSPSPSTCAEATALNLSRARLLAKIQEIRAVAILARDQNIAERDRLSAKRAAELAELRSGASKRAREHMNTISVTMGVAPINKGQMNGDVVEKAMKKMRAGEQVVTNTTVAVPPPATSAVDLVNEGVEVNDRYREQQNIVRMSNEIQKRNLALAKERLPKQPEAPRNKCHWDYLLEEMMALSIEIREERKWKIALAKRVSRLVEKYFADKDARRRRAEKEEIVRLRRKANAMAREVKKFWAQIGQIAEHRQSLLQEVEDKAKREKQLDFLIDETQKFTKAIAENLVDGKVRPSDSDRDPTPKNRSPVSDIRGGRNRRVARECREEISDSEDFDRGTVESTDDEETIEAEESRNKHSESTNGEEIRNLAVGAQLSVEDLLRQQGIDPAAYLNGERSEPNSNDGEEQDEATRQLVVADGQCCAMMDDNDHEFVFNGKDAKDDEATIEEEEKTTGTIQNAGEEARTLKTESERPIEDVIADYLTRGEPESEQESEPAGAKPMSERPKETDLCSMVAEPETPSRLEKPFLLKGNLRDYQHFGLEWLVSLYKKKLNGILADEMGLGKTIMTISLLAWLAINEGNWGPHLIIVPTSVLLNWEVEFKKWAPGLKTLTYYGGLKERRTKRIGWSKQNAFHVCLTSYAIAVQDSTMFRRRKWKYMILDEAHNIKNFQSQRWQTFLNFDTRRRLLLTGTPLQNSVMELWSLMHFLMPEVFRSHSEFRDWFSNPINAIVLEEKQGSEKENIVGRLHSVLRPFLLRRLKKEVEKGLPGKLEYVRPCRLSKRQRQLYEDFMARSDTEAALQSGNYIGVMNVLMQLRKVCNHPDLFDGRPIVSPFQTQAIERRLPGLVFGLVPEQLCHMPFNARVGARSFGSQSVTAASPATKEIHDYIEELNCPEVVDNSDDRLIEYRCMTLRTQSRLSRQRCEAFTSLTSSSLGFLAFVTSPLAENQTAVARGRWEYGLRSVSDLQKPWSQIGEESNLVSEMFGTCTTKVRSPPQILIPPIRWHRELDFAVDISVLKPIQTVFSSAVTRSLVDFPDSRLIQWDCGKLQEMAILLREIQMRGDRTLIFTQMTKVLDVLEAFLNLHDYRYLRLDGATKTEDRQRLMERYNTDPRIFCMILTTRAGGVGLNLTGANCVIFYDSDWNPAIDTQAQDRVHRIGQTKQVYIYRLICERTVEENILRKANEKRSLESLVISQAEFTTDTIKKFNALELVAPDRLHTSANQPAELQPVVPPDPGQGNSTNQGPPEDQMEQAAGFDLLLLAAEDHDKSLEAKQIAADEAEMENEDFKEEAPSLLDGDTVESIEKSAHFKEREIMEKRLNGIQRYCLHFIEKTPQNDVEAQKSDFVFEDEFTAAKLLARRDSDSEDSEEPLFYKTDVTGASHLKALTDTDEMKIFLPLRDGGPDDMVMSSVLGGTAAAGYQSAEDAAFYIYASARMSRTPKATTRQREAAKKKELDRKRRSDEARKLTERQQIEAKPSKLPTQHQHMVNIASGASSAESKTSSGTVIVKKIKITQPVFPLKLKSDSKVPSREKVRWTFDEDGELQKMCLRRSGGPGEGHPNFEYVSRWLAASCQTRSGRRSYKSPADCKDRFYVLAGDPAGTGAPDHELTAKFSAGSDTQRRSHLRKALASAGKKVRYTQKGAESFAKVASVHSSQCRLIADTEAIYGKAAPTPNAIIEKNKHSEDHTPGFKVGEEPKNLGCPEMRPTFVTRTGPSGTNTSHSSSVTAQKAQPSPSSGTTARSSPTQRAPPPGKQSAASNRGISQIPTSTAKARPQQGANGSARGGHSAAPRGGGGRGAFKRAIGLPPGSHPVAVPPPARPPANAPNAVRLGPTPPRPTPLVIRPEPRPPVVAPHRVVVSVGRPAAVPAKSTIRKGSGMLPGPGPGIPVAGLAPSGRGRPPSIPQARAQQPVQTPPSGERK